jgi:hypothetical protein
MIDQRSAVIACCSWEVDVITCVQFGSEQNALVSVRFGGHIIADLP